MAKQFPQGHLTNTLIPQNKTLLGSGPLGTLAYFGDANLMLELLGERPTLSLPTPPTLPPSDFWKVLAAGREVEVLPRRSLPSLWVSCSY